MRSDIWEASTAEGTPQGTMEVEELPCGKVGSDFELRIKAEVLTLETFNVLEA